MAYGYYSTADSRFGVGSDQQRLASTAGGANCFIDDIYNQQKILKDKVVPAELILNSGNFRKQCLGMKPKHEVWAHICGTDLIKAERSVLCP